MGARRSCAWIHTHPKMDSPKKCNPARSTNIGNLKMLMIESKETHRRYTEDNKELRSECLRLENELEFANRSLAQLHSTLQQLENETDRTNNNVRELVRCFDTWARDPLDFPIIQDLRSLRGMVQDIFTSVGFSGPGRIGNINGNGSDIGSD